VLINIEGADPNHIRVSDAVTAVFEAAGWASVLRFTPAATLGRPARHRARAGRRALSVIPPFHDANWSQNEKSGAFPDARHASSGHNSRQGNARDPLEGHNSRQGNGRVADGVRDHS
jgi:hypothetical protein